MPFPNAVYLLALASLGSAACSSTALPPLLRIEARNLRFTIPARISGGLTRVRLVNRDPVWHEASLIHFMDSTSTLDSYLAAARAGNEYPAFARDIGGLSFLAPGDSADVLVDLEPGRYAVVCWHRDHVLQGMGSTFAVVAHAGPSVAPGPSTEVVLTDFSVPPLVPHPGHELLHVTNIGPSEHELAILKLMPGKTYADFMAWRAAGEIGPAPARSAAGTAALRPGSEAWVDVTWTPGEYTLICLLEDSAGAYHADLGMRRAMVIR
ncbi:MAG: hypothetical protein ABJD11_03635 [Gemmatimonadota bacterium]